MHFPHTATLHTQQGPLSLKLKIARGLWSRFRGLMLTRKLKDEPNDTQALLIPRCPSVHGFFMLYSLDIVYLASEQDANVYSVTHTARLRPWCVSFGKGYTNESDASAVVRRSAHALELSAGIVQRLGIVPGHRFEVINP